MLSELSGQLGTLFILKTTVLLEAKNMTIIANHFLGTDRWNDVRTCIDGQADWNK